MITAPLTWILLVTVNDSDDVKSASVAIEDEHLSFFFNYKLITTFNYSCSQTRCQHNVIISTKRAVTALAINPINSYHIAVGCLDAVRLFDRRFLKTISEGNIDVLAVSVILMIMNFS